MQRKGAFSGDARARNDQMRDRKPDREYQVQGPKYELQNLRAKGKRVLFLQGHDQHDGNDTRSDTLIQKVNYQPSRAGGSKPNRYALHFYKESKEELIEKEMEALKSIISLEENGLEIDTSDFFEENLGFPKRPPWNANQSKNELETREHKYFQEYLKEIEHNYDLNELSYFELNLETWRQLWRVLEKSDIVLFIVDIRYPAVMFPPSLYTYVTEDLHKNIILILNKIDLVPAPLVTAWKHYFQEKYPLLKICMFTSLPSYNLYGKTTNEKGFLIRRQKGRIRMAAEGAQNLFEACQCLVGDKVDLTSWEKKIKEEMEEGSKEETKLEVGETLLSKNKTDYYQYEKFHEGILTIGCIGQPNVGKSLLINAVMGKKVVSVSNTPGHTKHFQTIFITNNIRFLDCPGLVFPSKVPKSLQVLMGSFPIAQLREPYTAIGFLAERLDLVKMLRLELPEDEETWSAMNICDSWAKKTKLIHKGGRLDSYRAGNDLLRMALDGKICLCLKPPNYTQKKQYWQTHPDTEKVMYIKTIADDSSKDMPEQRECKKNC